MKLNYFCIYGEKCYFDYITMINCKKVIFFKDNSGFSKAKLNTLFDNVFELSILKKCLDKYCLTLTEIFGNTMFTYYVIDRKDDYNGYNPKSVEKIIKKGSEK